MLGQRGHDHDAGQAEVETLVAQLGSDRLLVSQ
jgi:hypothetical protein